MQSQSATLLQNLISNFQQNMGDDFTSMEGGMEMTDELLEEELDIIK